MKPESILIKPLRPISPESEVSIPGSKSISNRALLLAALSNRTVELEGMLESEDTECMVRALQTLGVEIEPVESGVVRVQGVGGVFPVRKARLDVATAGTVARLLVGVLGVQDGGEYEVDGSEVMRGRPMEDLTRFLESAGCRIEFKEKPGALPFILYPSGFNTSELTVDASATSQVLSAVLMAAGLADEEVCIHLSKPKMRKPYVQMTARMMKDFGGPSVAWDEAFTTFRVGETHGYRPGFDRYLIEPDASAASYFFTLPLVAGGVLKLDGIRRSEIQGDTAYLGVLEALGLQVTEGESGIRVGGKVRMIHRETFDFYDYSDTFMTLASVAPLLPKPVTIQGLSHTRKQESDRVSAMAAELIKLGQEVEESEDSLTIFPDRKELMEVARTGIEIDTYRDHRIAMSFAVLGCADLLGDQTPWMTLNDPYCCAKTFPRFFDELERLDWR